MKEIVDEVLKTEEEAARIVQEARDKASQMKSSLEAETSEIVKKAKEDAQHIILDAVAKARTDADADYRNAMTEVDAENKKFMEKNEGKIGRLVDRIIELVQITDDSGGRTS
jgi:vacuolar-type H+-ATPase subunit E/Vma4